MDVQAPKVMLPVLYFAQVYTSPVVQWYVRAMVRTCNGVAGKLLVLTPLISRSTARIVCMRLYAEQHECVAYQACAADLNLFPAIPGLLELAMVPSRLHPNLATARKYQSG